MKKMLIMAAKAVHMVSNLFAWISAAVLFFMASVSFVDVIGRYFFHHPLTGAQEIIEVSMSIFVYTGPGHQAAPLYRGSGHRGAAFAPYPASGDRCWKCTLLRNERSVDLAAGALLRKAAGPFQCGNACAQDPLRPLLCDRSGRICSYCLRAADPSHNRPARFHLLE